VNTVQHAAIEEALFSVDPTDVPIDWLDSDHVICTRRSMSVPRIYDQSRELKSRERIGTMSAEKYKKSACEGLTCDLKALCVL
jgi:hypothetical protein